MQHGTIGARAGIGVIGPLAMIVFGLALLFTPLASVSSTGSIGNAGAVGKPSSTTAETTTTTVIETSTTVEATTSTVADTTTTAAPTSTIEETTTTVEAVTTTTAGDAGAPTTIAGAGSVDLPATGPSTSSWFVTIIGVGFVVAGIVLLTSSRRRAGA